MARDESPYAPAAKAAPKKSRLRAKRTLAAAQSEFQRFQAAAARRCRTPAFVHLRALEPSPVRLRVCPVSRESLSRSSVHRTRHKKKYEPAETPIEAGFEHGPGPRHPANILRFEYRGLLSLLPRCRDANVITRKAVLGAIRYECRDFPTGAELAPRPRQQGERARPFPAMGYVVRSHLPT